MPDTRSPHADIHWTAMVRSMLFEGFGSEDIAVRSGSALEDVQREIHLLDAEGHLAPLYAASRARSASRTNPEYIHHSEDQDMPRHEVKLKTKDKEVVQHIINARNRAAVVRRLKGAYPRADFDILSITRLPLLPEAGEE